ncbi:hypothetical protein [Nonomuraea wenchangensis]|uniref:Glycosyl transferase family 2 n=1 Tax=Nonomuraea wenchangensis TaxID=568860 RepID=A0A1I0EU03_9ACTN|nr:hypothetical protein [Nonomuraea wenchangensis]SET48919.1 hypothetical protein SAMN05421811_103201 [Nonomuraea wenchangensis]
MSVPLIVLGNGRKDCITQALASIRANLSGVGSPLIVDDSGDAAYRDWLQAEFTAEVVPVAEDRAGYWRAMRRVWQAAAGCRWVFFWEEDFVLNQPLDAADLATVLDGHPYLTQVALVRQPWFHNERERGGLIEALEAQGNLFQQRTEDTYSWIEHRACFTGNPSLIPASTLRRPWPEGDWSESRFGRELFTDPKARGAYWGRRDDTPLVTHIGHERAGHDY